MGKCLKNVCRNQMLHRIRAKKEKSLLVCMWGIARYLLILFLLLFRAGRVDADLENQSGVKLILKLLGVLIDFPNFLI